MLKTPQKVSQDSKPETGTELICKDLHAAQTALFTQDCLQETGQREECQADMPSRKARNSINYGRLSLAWDLGQMLGGKRLLTAYGQEFFYG